MKSKNDKEYYRRKYETTTHPGLKEYYRLRMEGHTPGCALDIEENYANCRCGQDKDGQDDI